MNMETMIVLWLTAAVVLAILDQWRRGGFGHGLEYAYAGLEGCDLKQDQKQQPEWMNLATFKKGGGSAPARRRRNRPGRGRRAPCAGTGNAARPGSAR